MAIDIEAAYRRYGPMVLRRCRRLLGNEEWAVDAMHDVFENLVKRGDALEDRGMSSYLYRAATNVSLNHVRARGRRPEGPDSETVERIALAGDAVAQTGARSMLARLFAGQPESSQTIAALHLLDGMTLEDVAREVGMSVSGVRKRLRRLRADLKELEAAA